MPIGFWAINRREVKEMIEARTGLNPTSTEINNAIRELQETLENTLNDVVIAKKYLDPAIRT